MRRLLLALAVLVALPSTAAAYDYKGANFSEAVLRIRRRHHAARRHPAAQGAARVRPRRRSSCPIGPYFNHSGQTGPAGPVEGTELRPGRAVRRAVRALRGLRRGRQAVRARLLVRDGRPARLRRLGRLPGLGRAGRAGRRQGRRRSGRPTQPWSTGNVGMYGKSYDGVTGLVGAVSNPTGPRRPSWPRSRSTTSTATCSPTASATRTRRRRRRCTTRSPRRPGRSLDDPMYNINGATDPACLATNYASQQDSQPRLRLLAGARPDHQGAEGQGPALPHPGLPREQHQARRDVGLLQRRGRAQARLVRHVGPRARQRTSAATGPTRTA